MDIIIHDYVWISLQYNHHIMMVSWLYKYYMWLSSMNGPWLPVRELLTWRWWTFPQRKGSDGEMTQFQRLLGPHRERLLSYRFPTLRNFRHPACPGSTGIYIYIHIRIIRIYKGSQSIHLSHSQIVHILGFRAVATRKMFGSGATPLCILTFGVPALALAPYSAQPVWGTNI